MTNTTNYNLNKPTLSDTAKITEHLSENMDIIDAKMKENESAISTLNGKIPSVANNLTTTTAGSVLDARQGKTLNDKITSHSHAWSSITGKPSTFTPTSHTHDDRYYTETEINDLRGWKQVGRVTGNNSITIPSDAFSSAKELMISWKLNSTVPWVYYIFMKDAGEIISSYYYSSTYYGCVGLALDATTRVVTVKTSWTSGKNGTTDLTVANLDFYLYYR